MENLGFFIVSFNLLDLHLILTFILHLVVFYSNLSSVYFEVIWPLCNCTWEVVDNAWDRVQNWLMTFMNAMSSWQCICVHLFMRAEMGNMASWSFWALFPSQTNILTNCKWFLCSTSVINYLIYNPFWVPLLDALEL